MADHKQISLFAESQNNETILLPRMLRVVNHFSFFIIENRLGFFKGNLMLFFVDLVFLWIPFKFYLIHNYIIITEVHFVNRTV